MSDSDRGSQRVGLGTFGAAVLTGWCALVAALPLAHVIQPGRWSSTSVLVVIAILASGLLVRWLTRRRPTWLRTLLTLLAQLAVLTLLLVQTSFALSASAGVLPNSLVFTEMAGALQRAGDHVRHGAAPLESTPDLAFAVALCVAVLALVLETLIVTARAPLAAGVVVAAVGITPSVIVPGDVNLVWFVLLALTLFLLLRLQVGRIRQDDTPRPRGGLTVLVGVAALVATVAIAPGVPVAATGFGGGAAMTLSPSLRLGEDLRRPAVSDVMTLITDADRAPYLRVVTLSTFDGEVWHPDDSDTNPLSAGFGPHSWGEDVESTEQRTSVRVIGLSSAWLPLPYPATEVRGLDGNWRVMTENRTVLSRRGDAAEQTYTVDSLIVEPTADQARLATASGSTAGEHLRALPPEMPPIIAQTAQEVTAGATNDYDRLLALQTWFRSSFRYSLDTPVDEGFDGTGVEAIAAFLEQRSGYCVHFAGAFAVMARSLDIPTRIVVGYLPGRESDDEQDGSPIYRVASDQLHSWPEVYFDQLGWVSFEPTATLGVPTRFAPATSPGSATGNITETPETNPDAPASNAPSQERRDQDAGASGSSARPALDPQPVMLGVLAVVLVLLVPTLVRTVRRLRRQYAAARGDAEAAWAELRDTLLDLGLDASSAESPRQRGERLVHAYRLDPEAMHVLVAAIERARFARPSARPNGHDDLTAALRTARQGLYTRTDLRDRMTATFAPRSLLGRRVTERATA